MKITIEHSNEMYKIDSCDGNEVMIKLAEYLYFKIGHTVIPEEQFGDCCDFNYVPEIMNSSDSDIMKGIGRNLQLFNKWCEKNDDNVYERSIQDFLYFVEHHNKEWDWWTLLLKPDPDFKPNWD